MCGRYSVVTRVAEIEKRFNVSSAGEIPFNTNISPGDIAPVITNREPGKLQNFIFGYTPFWAKKPMYLFNARSEGDHNKENDAGYHGAKGIITKPAFRHAIRSQRCLIVADCFIEGPQKEKLSRPYVVYMREKQRPFAIAGIWDNWVDKSTGEALSSFSIITTVANSLLQKVGHHRSPVVLPREYESAWLSEDTSLSDITAMLEPYPGELMNAYPISPAIKNPKANGLELLKPVGERVLPEQELRPFYEVELMGMGETRARKRNC